MTTVFCSVWTMVDPGRAVSNSDVAFVLHSYPYRETSLVVEAFTKAHGRMSVIARGARRPRSALRGSLLSFQPLLLTWSGRSELRTLHKVEWEGGLLALKGNALMCGFYLNELIIKLLPREAPHEQLFADYRGSLERLATGVQRAVTLRQFEKRLLKEIGYALILDYDAETGTPIRAEIDYSYSIERGPVALNGSDDVLKIAGTTLLDLSQDDYSNPVTLQQGRALMRWLINHHLNGQSLHTRQLLNDLRQL
jgi:DNA repair protein RecO (recombination protein O)